ncbi:MAG: gluconate 2-dehydrogenase subunit 3 family protein [Acidimicrobiales bacterium]
MSSTGGGGPTRGLTRRSFLKAALATGSATALLPLARNAAGTIGLASSSTGAAGGTPLPGGPYFLARSYLSPSDGAVHDLWATAQAICARIIPTRTNPLSGAVLSPGATEAGAVNYIDLFLAAFQALVPLPPGLMGSIGQKPLPSTLVTSPSGNPTNAPIYLNGRYSGRFGNADPATGTISPVADDFESAPGGPFVFLDLTPAESASWFLRLYGMLAPAVTPSWADPTWQQQVQGQVTGLGIPVPPALRGHAGSNTVYVEGMYEKGLVAFDNWADQNFGVGFAKASTLQQDALLQLASNPVLGAASSGGLPGLPPPLANPVPPADAATLFGTMVVHTIQGTYGLPEYAGRSDKAVNGTGAEPTAGSIWASIGWDGDTQPLGNSIYRLGPFNDGYGSYTDPVTNTAQPQGNYVEYRAVSTPDAGDGLLATASEIEALIQELVAAGVLLVTKGGGL